MPHSKLTAGAVDSIHAEVDIAATFPLRVGEVVWGDGRETHTERFALDTTHEFSQKAYQWDVKAPGWKWARVAVWDVAGGGAFSNITWRQ